MQVGITYPVTGTSVYPGQVTTPAQVTAPFVAQQFDFTQIINLLIPLLGIALVFKLITPLFKEMR